MAINTVETGPENVVTLKVVGVGGAGGNVVNRMVTSGTSGVEFIACQMSMDVMGVKREELLDEVTVGGVATYMDRAEQANVNLFI